MHRRHVLGLPAVLAAGWGGRPALAQSREKVRITLATNAFSFLPMLVAVAMDYFKAVDLEIETILTGSGAMSLASTISGNTDLCLEDPVSVLRARKNGADLLLFAAVATQVASNFVISNSWAKRHDVNGQSPVDRKLAALKGLRIGVTGVGSGTDHLARYLVKTAGLDPERDVTIVAVGGESMLAAFENGRVDALANSAPVSHVAMSRMNGTLLFNSPAGDIAALDGYFWIGATSTASWLRANRGKAVKVARALQMAMDVLRQPDQSLVVRDRIHQRYFPAVDKSVFDSAWTDQWRSSASSVRITREMMQQIIDTSESFLGEKLSPSLIEGAYVTDVAADATK